MESDVRVAVMLMVVLGVARPAAADPAGPCLPASLSIVPRCIGLSAGGSLAYKVTILCPNGPVVGSLVEVRFNTVGDSLICWCNDVPGPRPRSFLATTNTSGVATFNIAAGGCIELGLAAIPGPWDYVAEVFSDGNKVQECGTVSPDAVDSSGRLPTATPTWDPAGVCATGLADAVQHTTPLSTATYEWCTDINCDIVVGLADAAILTPYLAGAISCPGDQGP